MLTSSHQGHTTPLQATHTWVTNSTQQVTGISSTHSKHRILPNMTYTPTWNRLGHKWHERGWWCAPDLRHQHTGQLAWSSQSLRRSDATNSWNTGSFGCGHRWQIGVAGKAHCCYKPICQEVQSPGCPFQCRQHSAWSFQSRPRMSWQYNGKTWKQTYSAMDEHNTARCVWIPDHPLTNLWAHFSITEVLTHSYWLFSEVQTSQILKTWSSKDRWDMTKAYFKCEFIHLLQVTIPLCVCPSMNSSTSVHWVSLNTVNPRLSTHNLFHQNFPDRTGSQIKRTAC